MPPGLEGVVARCLAKEPNGRYADYRALRNALLPFSSKEPEPASMKLRASAGWIDYLIAFLPPYVIMMLLVGGEKLLFEPHLERTLYSARYYILLFSLGFLYFGVVEGIWGAGLGKRLKGLRVVRADRRPVGIGRALIRIIIPIGCIEGVRVPLMLATLPDADWTGPQIVWFVVAANICAWIPVLLTVRARRENAFATVWDLVSGTRVVVTPKGTVRPTIAIGDEPGIPAERADSLGPYRIITEMASGQWLVGTDPVLRRQVWLLRRDSLGPSPARRNVARSGRSRWLQKVETPEATWDAFEAAEGVPFSSLLEGGKRVPWARLRHWLHDLASESWEAAGDQTLPAELSLDHIWITAQGRAVLLDDPWPEVRARAERIPVGDLAGQQRFLCTVAARADATSLPLHARGVLRNLADGKFEKLSFLTGILRGLLDKPVEISRGIRAGAIFMLALYVWVTVYVGYYHGGGDGQWGSSPAWRIVFPAMVVLGVIAVIQLLELALVRTTASHAIFRLAIVDGLGEPVDRVTLLRRWAFVWLPLLVPMSFIALSIDKVKPTAAILSALAILLLWIGGAIHAAMHPHRGLHDRLAGTWVVRR
jgi:uncharacterized RDD family membrane protein YckC